MKREMKWICSMLLTAAVLAGTVLSGCAESTDYVEEVKQYQARLEELEAENQQLRTQLELLQASMETPAGTETATQQPDQTAETAPETTQQPTQTAESQEAPEADTEDGLVRVLVLGDSIWGNYRDETGIAAKVEYYMQRLGYTAKVYNAAIGGTRATLDPQDSEWEYGPASDNNLGKMTSILLGRTDVGLLQGKPAYDAMQEAIALKQDMDLVILAYGMNDFLSQAPINDSDRPWIGFGTALVKGIQQAREACPNAEVMVITPSYASYFSIPVQNMGSQALYNYASVACDAAKGEMALCVDAYNNIGIDAYNADEYLADGVHLNENGRDLYARNVVSCYLFGNKGEVSGNRIYDFDNMQQ